VKWIDGHLDLAYLAVSGRDLRVSCQVAEKGCVSLPALREAGVEIAFATIFTGPGEEGPVRYPTSDDLDAAEAAGLRQLQVYEKLESEGELTIVRNLDDLMRDTPLPRVVLLMEGADPIRSPDHVQPWFERGLRMVGLTWHRGTRYAGGNGTGDSLTPIGVEMVRALDAAGLAHDASHLSDAALDGVLEHATGRIVATHSNCRALLDENERHLRDGHIAAIVDRDGIVGLNLYSGFLSRSGRATIEDCIHHVEHICKLVGRRDAVALGSDMDGGFTPLDLPVDLDHPMKLDVLAEALRDRGWSDSDIAGFAHGNWRRFLEKLL
jgi:membrane dipeptidase